MLGKGCECLGAGLRVEWTGRYLRGGGGNASSVVLEWRRSSIDCPLIALE